LGNGSSRYVMPARLRSFVAMAFGQKDTDAIFKILRKTPEAITSGNATTTRTATAMSTSISRCATSSLGHRRATRHFRDD
jgi:hypothetical protein